MQETGIKQDTVYDFLEDEVWLSMLKVRNDLTHIYDGDAARRMVKIILEAYIPAFEKMKDGMEGYYGDSLDEIDL